MDPVTLSLVERAYAAASSPSEWPDFLELFASAVHGVVPAIVIGGSQKRSIVADCPETAVKEFETHWAEPMARVARALGASAVWCHSDMSDPVLSALHEDWGRRLGLGDCLSGHWLSGVPQLRIGIYRERRCASFDETDRSLMAALLPHVRRALVISNALGDVAAERDAAVAVLDRVSVGVMLLSSDGRTLASNGEMERLLSSGDGLAVTGGRLRILNADAARRLEKLLSAADEGIPSATRSILVRRSNGRPLMLRIAVLPSDRFRLGSRRCAVAIFVTDPDRPPTLEREQMLREGYGLTPSESRLAGRLLEGKSLQEIAEDLCVTEGTLRGHLKAVFAKTGTHRQAELVALLLS